MVGYNIVNASSRLDLRHTRGRTAKSEGNVDEMSSAAESDAWPEDN